MADKSGSPAFKPPMDRVTDDDPSIIRIDLTKVEWAFRKSQQPQMDSSATGPVRHVQNGS